MGWRFIMGAAACGLFYALWRLSGHRPRFVLMGRSRPAWTGGGDVL